MLICSIDIIANPNIKEDKAGIYGTVSSIENGKRYPVDYTIILLKPSNIYTTTNNNGQYNIEGLDSGEYSISIQMIGYKNIDTTIILLKAEKKKLDFILEESSFRLNEVNVVAQKNKSSDATSSLISRQAIDHSQTSSLSDIMQLLPGVSISNPNMNESQSLTLRTVNPSSMNSLGTSIIMDGSPISNNANMEGINAAITGTVGSIAGAGAKELGSVPNSGADVRSISTDNIESVEVIRGIPSAQYGDLTAGAVIITTKQGAEPLNIKLKTDPKIFQTYISKGIKLKKNYGDLHFAGDYAYSNAKTTEKYVYYQRLNLKTTWGYHKNNFNNSTSVEFKFGKDTRDRNLDDKSASLSSGGRNLGYRFSIKGTWTINKGWLKSLKYDFSNSYIYKNSYKEQDYVNATFLHSTNMENNSTISNFKGRHIYDINGDEITNFNSEGEQAFLKYMPYTYFSHYDFIGKELNTYAKAYITFFKNIKKTSDRIILGADFKSDGNLGEGLLFKEGFPPYKNTNTESGYRERKLYTIPFINQLGIFGENYFKTTLFNRELNFTAGLRFDFINHLSALSPRVNISYDLIPKIFAIRGGYGITAKAPTAAYMYPNNAYCDQANYNATNAPNEKDKLVLATTYIFKTENKELKPAINQKSEIGIDIKLFNKYKLGVTFYNELMKNGYEYGADLRSIHWIPYKYYEKAGNDAEGYPILKQIQDGHTFFVSYMPLNTAYERNYGLEFELDLGRFKAIRTAFHLNGAWMHTINGSSGQTFERKSNKGSTVYSHISVYKPLLATFHSEKAITTLRIIHNIPQIGFVVTLTSQLHIYSKFWTDYINDEIPESYISNEDGKMKPFTKEMANNPDFKYMINQKSPSRFISEKYKTTLVFNMNISKEIKDFMTASFYVNNIFNSRPLDPSEVTPGAFTELNNPIYFGFELKFKL